MYWFEFLTSINRRSRIFDRDRFCIWVSFTWYLSNDHPYDLEIDKTDWFHEKKLKNVVWNSFLDWLFRRRRWETLKKSNRLDCCLYASLSLSLLRIFLPIDLSIFHSLQEAKFRGKAFFLFLFFFSYTFYVISNSEIFSNIEERVCIRIDRCFQ